jgi:quercetin dioxygenase-like cupin family protein
MKRSSTLVGGAAVVAAAVVGVAATVALAGPSRSAEPSGVQITPLAQGTIGSKVHADSAGISIRTKGPRAMLVTSITVDPGGSFGWHTHPGPVLVAMSKGTLTVYHADGSRCVRSTVTAGQAFVEDGRDVHLARNEGSAPVELNAIFLARTGTTEFLTTVPQPKGCNV